MFDDSLSVYVCLACLNLLYFLFCLVVVVVTENNSNEHHEESVFLTDFHWQTNKQTNKKKIVVVFVCINFCRDLFLLVTLIFYTLCSMCDSLFLNSKQQQKKETEKTLCQSTFVKCL